MPQSLCFGQQEILEVYSTSVNLQQQSIAPYSVSKNDPKSPYHFKPKADYEIKYGRPILNKKFKTIGDNEVSIPEFYYKIILDVTKPEIKAIAFLMKNEKSSKPLTSFVVSIDQIEELSGLDFFPTMPDDLENALEGSVTTVPWFN